MDKKDFFILSFILIIALALRLYRITTPLADLHSWRQADTAAVARNFVRGGFDLLHPRYDDLSSIESGKENPQGYRMVEFPIYNALFATLYNAMPLLPIEVYGRLTSVFSSLVITTVIYLLLRKEVNQLAATVGSLAYASLPFSVFFSRTVLPETTALAFVMLSIYSLYSSLDGVGRTKKIILYVGSLVCFAISLLIKPTTIFYALVLVYLFYKTYRGKVFTKLPFYLYFLIGIIPLIAWRLYIKSYPEGIPVNDWLLTKVNTYQGLQIIFFRPAFFRWIFYERIATLILGGYGIFFFLLGIVKKPRRYFFHTFLAGALLYLFTFQGGNVQHEYYQILILPPIAVFIGLGVEFLLSRSKNTFHLAFTYLMIFMVTAFTISFSYYKVKDYYNYSSDLTQIGKVIQTLTLPNDRIATDTTGDTTLLYLSDRKGTPALHKDPATLRELGYKYMVIFNKDYISDLKSKNFVSVFENDKFTMFLL
ncbi:glycosyltransferase family 39 protein [Candidatus Roizmanbacteria bacterium]|nr:glycosyltransferase family 39 protein [Candidatus Roizmanbacteria bacterium]